VIIYVVRRGFSFTIGQFLGASRSERVFASNFRILSYEQLFKLSHLPLATYIFTDHERLSALELEKLAWIWKRLEGSDKPVRLLNDPLKVRKRYSLLSALYAAGLNKYRAYRVTEPDRPDRFPVFLRGENDHKGPRSKLIETPDELEQEVARHLKRIRFNKVQEPTLIVEYCAETNAEGHFVKYSAFKVGDEIVARHRFVATHWDVKKLEVLNEETLQAEREYVTKNPHKQKLAEIFELANIDYGRIDYSLIDGEIQTYEINTNPMTVGMVSPPERDEVDTLFAKRFSAALMMLDTPWHGKFIFVGQKYNEKLYTQRYWKRLQQYIQQDYHRSLYCSMQQVFEGLKKVVPYPYAVFCAGRRQLWWLLRNKHLSLFFRMRFLVLVIFRMLREAVRSCWIRSWWLIKKYYLRLIQKVGFHRSKIVSEDRS